MSLIRSLYESGAKFNIVNTEGRYMYVSSSTDRGDNYIKFGESKYKDNDEFLFKIQEYRENSGREEVTIWAVKHKRRLFPGYEKTGDGDLSVYAHDKYSEHADSPRDWFCFKVKDAVLQDFFIKNVKQDTAGNVFSSYSEKCYINHSDRLIGGNREVMHVRLYKEADNIDLKKWMQDLGDEKLFSETTVPGTHDSGCWEGNFQALPDFLSEAVARTQYYESFKDQLNSGVRALDIRVVRQSKSSFGLVHGPAYLKGPTFSSLLDYCIEFLRENPSEFLFFSLREDQSPDSDESTMQETFEKYVNDKGREHWYLGENVRSIKEVRGKIILLRRFDKDKDKESQELGLNWGSLDKQDDYTPENVNAKKEKVLNQFEKAKNGDKKKVFVNFTSANKVTKNPLTILDKSNYPSYFASYLNSYVEMYLYRSRLKNERPRLGIIMMDYITRDVCIEIVKSN